MVSNSFTLIFILWEENIPLFPLRTLSLITLETKILILLEGFEYLYGAYAQPTYIYFFGPSKYKYARTMSVS